MSKEQRKPNASERIEALELALVEMNDKVIALAQVIDENAEQVDGYVEQVDRKIISLGKRMNATLTATDSNDAVEKIIQQDSARELETMVKTLVEQGLLERADNTEIEETSFVVGRHISSEGDELTPRLQFYTGSLAPEEKAKFIGKKVGDMVVADDESVSIEVTEVYKTINGDKEVEFTDDEEKSEEKNEAEDVVEQPQEENKESESK